MKRFFFTACGMALGVALTLCFTFLTAHTKPAQAGAPAPTDLQCGEDKFYGLTAEEFMQGVARYKNTHSQVINGDAYMDSNHINDARSCWYSLDTLKKFICWIEKYGNKLNIKPDKLGIRFYYAVYGSDPAKLANAKFRSRHTLFMMPTHLSQAGTNVDFDPRHSAVLYTPGKTRVLFDVTTLPRNVQPLMLDGISTNAKSDNEDDPVGKNQGQLCPPNCPLATQALLHYIDSAYKDVNYKN